MSDIRSSIRYRILVREISYLVAEALTDRKMSDPAKPAFHYESCFRQDISSYQRFSAVAYNHAQRLAIATRTLT